MWNDTNVGSGVRTNIEYGSSSGSSGGDGTIYLQLSQFLFQYIMLIDELL